MSCVKAKPLRIATRKSPLAQAQASKVKDKILRYCPEYEVEFVYYTTTGDEVLDRPLAEIGGKGLFVKTLEEALLYGKADIAVHSLKDVPSMISEEFSLIAYVERETPLDVMVSSQFDSFNSLPKHSRVGTSSPRRKAQLKNLRPDLEVRLLRGNVNTRIDKILKGELDAGIMAYAGLQRLGLAGEIREVFPAHMFLPAPGQGIIAVECLTERRAEFSEMAKKINDSDVEKMGVAERSFSAALAGNCYSAIAALAQICGTELSVMGAVFSPEGEHKVEGVKTLELSHGVRDFEELGTLLAKELERQGARRLLECH
jgi:hydroxymethylbilane synthase